MTFDLNEFRPIFDYELRHVRLADKEDVQQTCLLRLFNTLHKNANYAGQGLSKEQLGGLLRTVIRCTVIDYYRQVSRPQHANTCLVHWNDGCSEEGNAGSVDSFHVGCDEVRYTLAEVRLDFYNNRDKFTPQEQRILDYLLDTSNGLGHSLSEVSSQLGIHKSHASRAFKKLQRLCH